MPNFTVIPKAAQLSAMEVNVPDPQQVLAAVEKLPCEDAEVLRDGEYVFSIHRGGGGMWIISDRHRR